MTDNLNRNLFELRNHISKIMDRLTISFHNTEDRDIYIKETIAYLFICIYGQHKNTNIHKYAENKPFFANEDEPDDTGFEDRMREAESLLSKQHKAFIEFSKSWRLYTSKEQPQKDVRQGIPYDMANMLMIDNVVLHDFEHSGENKRQKYTLFEILKNSDITSSKKVSTSRIIDAYFEFDNLYKTAKTITDKTSYINHWVNLYRLEIRLSFSLINQIADYMLENNISNLPEDTGLLPMLWQHQVLQMANTECYDVLRYHEYIPFYFSDYNNIDFYNMKKTLREAEVILRRLSSKVAKCAFKPFFDGKPEALITMYDFCRKSYPIIEKHKPIIFNEETSHKKVKLLRKIFNAFFPDNCIKSIYS